MEASIVDKNHHLEHLNGNLSIKILQEEWKCFVTIYIYILHIATYYPIKYYY